MSKESNYTWMLHSLRQVFLLLFYRYLASIVIYIITSKAFWRLIKTIYLFLGDVTTSTTIKSTMMERVLNSMMEMDLHQCQIWLTTIVRIPTSLWIRITVLLNWLNHWLWRMTWDPFWTKNRKFWGIILQLIGLQLTNNNFLYK